MASKSKGKAPARKKLLKDETIRMRIPAEQKAALVAAADREGLDLSVWLRRVALRAAGVLPAPAG
jgi:uncharacterized protein (DUF1778 family)